MHFGDKRLGARKRSNVVYNTIPKSWGKVNYKLLNKCCRRCFTKGSTFSKVKISKMIISNFVN